MFSLFAIFVLPLDSLSEAEFLRFVQVMYLEACVLGLPVSAQEASVVDRRAFSICMLSSDFLRPAYKIFVEEAVTGEEDVDDMTEAVSALSLFVFSSLKLEYFAVCCRTVGVK